MFRKLSLPLAMLVAVGTLSAYCGAFGASALEPMRDDFLIRNTVTGRYLTVANNAQSAGTPVVLYEADGVGSENCWSKFVTADGQTLLRTNSGYALTVGSDGALTLGDYEKDNIYQCFTLEGRGESVRLTAGGWALTPDYNINGSAVRMTDSGSLSDWELIAVNQKRTYHMGDVNR
ncbi:MAG: RICIN domain-containing protein, partial [Oscillospiraceae bacterium]|nr:RICIN domain-containing protein [Oscillospiraceae bacterium]